MAIEAIVEELRNIGEDVEFFGPSSTEDIKRVEDGLGLKINSSVKDFLVKYGGGGVIDGPSVCGIIPGDPLSENVYTLYGATIHARSKFNLKPNFLVVRIEDPELVWCIDTSNSADSSVFALDTGSSGTIRKISGDFNQMLEEYFLAYLNAMRG